MSYPGYANPALSPWSRSAWSWGRGGDRETRSGGEEAGNGLFPLPPLSRSRDA
jgi:hypothetical protein